MVVMVAEGGAASVSEACRGRQQVSSFNDRIGVVGPVISKSVSSHSSSHCRLSSGFGRKQTGGYRRRVTNELLHLP